MYQNKCNKKNQHILKVPRASKLQIRMILYCLRFKIFSVKYVSCHVMSWSVVHTVKKINQQITLMNLCNNLVDIFIPSRSWQRGEPAWRNVCERETTARTYQAEDRTAFTSRRQTVWYIQTTAGISWMCQQNSGKVCIHRAVITAVI